MKLQLFGKLKIQLVSKLYCQLDNKVKLMITKTVKKTLLMHFDLKHAEVFKFRNFMRLAILKLRLR
jgi:hypothetical protein